MRIPTIELGQVVDPLPDAPGALLDLVLEAVFVLLFNDFIVDHFVSDQLVALLFQGFGHFTATLFSLNRHICSYNRVGGTAEV